MDDRELLVVLRLVPNDTLYPPLDYVFKRFLKKVRQRRSDTTWVMEFLGEVAIRNF